HRAGREEPGAVRRVQASTRYEPPHDILSQIHSLADAARLHTVTRRIKLIEASDLMTSNKLPRVLADLPVGPVVERLVAGRVELAAWSAADEPGADRIEAILTYGHPTVSGPLLDKLPRVRVVSNFGVGVDHI